MKTKIIKNSNGDIALIESNEILIYDSDTALDFIANASYQTGCRRFILSKSAIAEEFFDLSSRIAGEIIQKLINYHIKLAVIGEFDHYESKALKDFICECNNGRDIFFVPGENEAVRKFASIK